MFTSHHHHAPTSPPAGPAAPIIASAHATSPGPVSPTSSRSARLRTLSVIRSVTQRVTTVATSQSSSSPSSSVSASASAPVPASAPAPASHDSAGPTPPSPGHHSPRSIWPHSPIRRSLSYTPAVASQTSAAPGARESVSEESIARSKSHVPSASPAAEASTAESSGQAQGHGHGNAHHGIGHRLGHGVATALAPALEPLAITTPITTLGTTPQPSREPDHHPAQPQLQPQPQSQSHPSPSPSSSPELQAASDTMSLASGAPAAHAQNPAATLPSIRFTAYVDPRAQRPSLTFSHTTRILPSGFEVIRVGRYSERDGHGTVSNTGSDRTPNASPVGFKSKVVSRRHCEFWFENSKWYIKDVKSSSGTFLNHIRLSPPGTESKPYVVNDGDIVQLGIDFKGGEEMIFRCVKIRLELNRGWASRPSNFNLASHKRLRSLVSQGSSNSQDCSICLNSIAPCQSLFVAPCSHTWHYKCIRSLLNTPQYPYFQCPNCRASADLEAEVEEPDEDWERLSDVQEASADSDSEGKGKETVLPSIGLGTGMGVGTTGTVINQSDDVNSAHSDPLSPSLQTSADAPARTSTQMLTDPDAASSSRAQPSSTSSADSQSPSEWSRSAPVPIASSNGNTANSGAASSSETTPSAMGFHRPGQRTPSPSNNPAVHGADGPITPRNDAGPWVFDGSAGRRAMAALGVGVGVAMPAFAPGGRAAEANPGSIDGIMDTDDDER